MLTSSVDPVAGRELWLRNLRRSALALAVSNALAAVIVFVYLAYVVPTPVIDSAHARLLNLVVFVAFIAVVFPSATWFSLRNVRRVRVWMEAGRLPTPAERDHSLGAPLVQLKILAVGWGAGAVVFF